MRFFAFRVVELRGREARAELVFCEFGLGEATGGGAVAADGEGGFGGLRGGGRRRDGFGWGGFGRWLWFGGLRGFLGGGFGRGFGPLGAVVGVWRGGCRDGSEVVVEEVVGLAGLCEFVHAVEVSMGWVSVLGSFGLLEQIIWFIDDDKKDKDS